MPQITQYISTHDIKIAKLTTNLRFFIRFSKLVGLQIPQYNSIYSPQIKINRAHVRPHRNNKIDHILLISNI